jgi:hypothetical protein
MLTEPRMAPRHLALAVVLSAAIACGDDGGTPSSSSSGGDTTGAGGATSSSTTSGGSTTSSSSSSTGSGGEGGQGGAPPPTTGVPGKELVNAGTVMTSPGYKLHVTIGQPSPAQGTHTSDGHKLRGGVTGTTQ